MCDEWKELAKKCDYLLSFSYLVHHLLFLMTMKLPNSNWQKHGLCLELRYCPSTCHIISVGIVITSVENSLVGKALIFYKLASWANVGLEEFACWKFITIIDNSQVKSRWPTYHHSYVGQTLRQVHNLSDFPYKVTIWF